MHQASPINFELLHFPHHSLNLQLYNNILSYLENYYYSCHSATNEDLSELTGAIILMMNYYSSKNNLLINSIKKVFN